MVIVKNQSILKNLKGISDTFNSQLGTTNNFVSAGSSSGSNVNLGDFIFNNYTLSTSVGTIILSGNILTTNLISNTIKSNNFISTGERVIMNNVFQSLNVTNFNNSYINVTGNVSGTLSNSTLDFFEKFIIVTNISSGNTLSLNFQSSNGMVKATFTKNNSSLLLIYDNIQNCWHIKNANCYITPVSFTVIP